MRIFLLSLFVTLAVGCSKPNVDAAPVAQRDPSLEAKPEVPAPSVEAPPNAAPSTTTDVTSPRKSTPTAVAPVAVVDAGPTCGRKPLPDCPLQAWMKSHSAPAMASSDMPGLEAAFTRIAAFAPPGYPHWSSISKDGARAAHEAQMDAVKAACRSCHEQYKAKYKAELRPRALP